MSSHARTTQSTEPDPTRSSDGRADDDKLDHYVCCGCDPHGRRALCGADTSRGRWVEDVLSSRSCVVCNDLGLLPCDRCGR